MFPLNFGTISYLPKVQCTKDQILYIGPRKVKVGQDPRNTTTYGGNSAYFSDT